MKTTTAIASRASWVVAYAAVLFVASTTGCEPMAEIEPLPADLEVGLGTENGTGFVQVQDGQDVVLVPGAQGGFHVWVNVRVHGIAGEFYLEREARRRVDDELVSLAIPQYIAIADDAMLDWWDNPEAMPSFMCPAPLGLKVFDEELYFDVRVVDEDGAVMAADQMFLTVRCPDGAQAAFCRDICSGNP